jgi:hypothetical protein
MASVEQVKKYLAYWFQAGKPIICPWDDRPILPKKIIIGDRYSSEFEMLFTRLLTPECRDCYLRETNQSMGDLLSGRWDMWDCARCQMPIPLDRVGLITGCPCADLNGWPNLDLPMPRCPNNVRAQLTFIHQRLQERLQYLA